MQSAEETTSPRGCECKLHIREKSGFIYENKETKEQIDEEEFYNLSEEEQNSYNVYGEDVVAYEVWSWGINGNRPFQIDSFDNEDDAINDIFQRTWKYDFESDINRDTRYFETEEDANNDIIQLFADRNSIDFEVAANILRKTKIISQVRSEKRAAFAKKESDRINKLAEIYAQMIDKIDGESFKATASRLSSAIGSKIESGVFFKAVKLIRNK